jgi:hypothetical protein
MATVCRAYPDGVDALADLLAAVHAEQRRWGDEIRPPASDAAIAAASAAVTGELGCPLPTECARLWALSDGLDFDGVVLYDTCSRADARSAGGFWQGVVEANLLWRDDPANRELLVVGETDLDLLARHLPSGTWQRLDRVGRDRATTLATLDELVADALAPRL